MQKSFLLMQELIYRENEHKRRNSMKLVEEIREGFASVKKDGALAIKALPPEYPAFIIRIPDGFGTAICVPEDMEVAERFNNCCLKTGQLSLDGNAANYLMLTSAFEEFRYEFASLCAEFVEQGNNGENRKLILEDPIKWWKNWKALVGNSDKEQRAYSTIAEMEVLLHILKTHPDAEWSASRMGSHDVECNSESCEVKSTLKRYGAIITVAGQHQLVHNKPLYLYFCRMEESFEGVSINDMKRQLVGTGFDAGKLETELQQMGFERGSSIRDKKYKFLEKRKYAVDENFPVITKDSFKNDVVPSGIVHVEYSVDLDALESTAW